MILGFTGTGDGMTPRQAATVFYLFQELQLRVLHHGDCVGADVQAHRFARQLAARIVLHPPTVAKFRGLCLDADEIRPCFTYLTRNRHIVAEALDGVVAAPRSFVPPKNLRGQGTWTTIGYAEQAGRRRWIVYPDGTFKDFEAEG